MRLLLCILLIAGCAGPVADHSTEGPSTAEEHRACTVNGMPCEDARETLEVEFTASTAQPFTWSFWFAGGNLTLTLATQVTAYNGVEVSGDTTCHSPTGIVSVLGTSSMGISCGHVERGDTTLTLTPTGLASGTISIQGARAGQ